ncbi:MAG: fructosamine kinase family protein [Hyphomicrobiales bacterium]
MKPVLAGTMTQHNLESRLKAIFGQPIGLCREVAKNYGFRVYEIEVGSTRYAVKTGHGEVIGQLAIEARMLADLARDGSLKVPKIHHSEDDLLILEWIETDGARINTSHERAAGEAFARLHSRPAPAFGYPYDTTIGSLAQPNPASQNWVEFFRDARLVAFAHQACQRGLIPARLLSRIEQLGARLGDLLPEPRAPALVHGDAWFGNILTRGDDIAVYIDPALYHASPEIELAYVTMHHTFGRLFFEAYAANATIEPGFFEDRIDILNIYPNLVHIMLCGPSYIAPIERVLDRLGL